MRCFSCRFIHTKVLPVVSLLCVCFLLPVSALAQMGGDYDASWTTVDCGGGESTGGKYTVVSTFGQADAGTVSGGKYTFEGGFLTQELYAGRTWYADDDAPDDPCCGNPDYSDPCEDGTTEHPFDAIQEAIDIANDGDTVIVLPGTYTGDDNRDIDFDELAITVRSTDPNDPNIVAATVIDCNGTPADPHRGFIFENEEEADSILSGLTIINSYASDGGGIYCDGTNPTITSCTFSGNSAILGGGMYNNGSSPTVTGCTFSGNSAIQGGGMANDDGSPTVTSCTFTGNSAHIGGGMANDGGSPILNNCTFIDNIATSNGGGIWNQENNAAVTDCTFSSNSADDVGGGMYNEYSSPTLTNCTFRGNLADAGGGGMFNTESSSPMITDCNFSGNTAEYDGGAIYNEESSPMLTNCTFGGNFGDHGGGMRNWSSSPTLAKCTFSGNLADGTGGGICNEYGSPTLTDCNFTGNLGWGGGGGMFNENSSPTLTNCTFSRNSADWGGGGGILNDESSPVLTNCTFTENLADCTFTENLADYDDGGGIYNENESDPTLTNCTFSGNSADWGGGIYNDDSSPTLTNCTFSGNVAEDSGGGMYNDEQSGATLANCILWGNTASDGNEIALFNSSTIDVNYCDVKGGQGGVYVGSGCTVNWGDGNIDTDPCFVDTGYWADANDPNITVEPNDPNATWIDGDYHLRPRSPCIDVGDNDSVPEDTNDLDGDGNTTEPIPWDLDGHPRIVDGNNDGNSVVDMGAYEYFPFVATFDVNERTRIDRTWFRYKCWVTMENRSPHAVENVGLELVDVPDNIEVNDPCVSYPYIEAESSATSEDTCTFDVNRIEPIKLAEIVWRITYEIAGTGEEMQQMSSTVVLLEPVGLASGDITGEGIVDIDDVARMADDWLGSGSLADIYPAPPYGDDIVNFQDFTILAENWLAGE